LVNDVIEDTLHEHEYKVIYFTEKDNLSETKYSIEITTKNHEQVTRQTFCHGWKI